MLKLSLQLLYVSTNYSGGKKGRYPFCFRKSTMFRNLYNCDRHWLHYTRSKYERKSYLILHSRTNSKRDYCCGRKLNFSSANAEKLFADSSTLPPNYNVAMRSSRQGRPFNLKNHIPEIVHTLRLGTKSSYPLHYCALWNK